MVEYNPFWDEVIDDPFPIYRRMRDEKPACYVEEIDCWALSRFADITRVSMDRKDYTVSRGSTLTSLARRHRGSDRLMNDSTMFMMMDPPRHSAFRALLSPHFTPRKLAAAESVVRRIVSHYLDPILEAGRFDAVGELARKVASHVTCELLGLSVEDAPILREFVQRGQPWIHGRPPSSPEEIAQAAAGLGDLAGFLEERVAERRRSAVAHDDILATFVEAQPEGRRLRDEEIAVQLSGLVVGGFETLPKHFGSVIYWLHHFPEQRARIVADPGLLPSAVEEVFRYDAPTHVLGRRAVNDVEWHGERVRAGQGVLLLYASGNRDDRVFERPDVFDVGRKPGRTVTFGAGIHLCMGMHVARLESRLMLEGVLANGPEYAVEAEGVERCRLAGIHGYDAMPIVLEP